MAEDPTQAGTGAPSADPQPSQGNTTSPTTPAPGEPGTTQTVNNPEAKKYADEAAAERRARKALEAELAQYRNAQKEAELAKLGETERLQKQYQQAQEQLAALQLEQQQYRLAREIAKLAPSLNLIDPDAALLMLQAGGELDTDDKGHYTNVGKLLEKLVAEKPYLIASNVRTPPPPPSSGGATNPGRGAAQPPSNQPKADPKAVYEAHRQRGGLGNPNLWKR